MSQTRVWKSSMRKPPVSFSVTARLLPRALPLVMDESVKSPGPPAGPDWMQLQ
jgi:hypothetical protein